MPRELPEAVLQQILLAHLNTIPGVFVWRANTGAARTKGGRTVRFGKRGQGDLLGLVCGRFLAIEVKGPRGRQSKDQREFQRVIEEHGGLYLLATDFETTMRAVADAAGVSTFPIPQLAP